MSESNTMPPPPPYSESIDISTQLKGSFVSLLTSQQDIQALFATVAEQLVTAPRIGEHHPLTEEWMTLRKSTASLEAKTKLIQDFIEAIDRHKTEAKSCSEQFISLKERVELFRGRLSRDGYVPRTTEPRGFFANIYSWITNCFSEIGKVIGKLIDRFEQFIRQLCSALKSIHIFLGERLNVDHAHVYSRLPEEHEMRPLRDAAPDIGDTISRLAGNLAHFDHAWDVVRASCDQLRTELTLANHTAAVLPSVFESYLKKVRAIYLPLVECMRAYSLGCSPRF
ncbi:hypothetical protein DAEQUDRAFT_665500 [Daedalea quercina L-15889]|uniref:Uncharacterized protein n=1 Tax=Daedalea quercina L-15889 TaxID=1314783 RepID=A0A165S999_9APHY|nr:hypothetical protein DAEQUDRAFT_665500 [Daedalea quercina L-15889]